MATVIQEFLHSLMQSLKIMPRVINNVPEIQSIEQKRCFECANSTDGNSECLFYSRCIPVPLEFTTLEPAECHEDKAPIIFLHGVTASKEYWCDVPVKVANATKRKVHILDARNHGDSPWSNHFNCDTNVADVLHFMDEINITKAIIVGHSMGGATAIGLAFKEPQKVEKLFIEDVSIGAFPEHVITMLRHKLMMSQKAMENLPTDLNITEARDFIADYVIKSLPPEV
ncbi:abhydrolase domain-containing protein 11 [Nephila pilipes]|uniref:sn-1-specific diacylglycerol lipase ABHD11 n=1 Tax=Nephila pilipes TaxID=299642 RepID=A0A8X6TEG7_NEPPI|nr:abhydrolase domain-containing protein 11 [Nephila pilipes]